jgi:hypothetical protein
VRHKIRSPDASCRFPLAGYGTRGTGHALPLFCSLPTTHYSLSSNRLTKLQKFPQLPQTTPLPCLTFERYHSIISLDSNIISCYHLPWFARVPPNITHSPSLPRNTNHSARTTLFLNSSHQYHSTPLTCSLCFHTLTHSFATFQDLSPISSIDSALFVKNTRVGVGVFKSIRVPSPAPAPQPVCPSPSFSYNAPPFTREVNR